MSTPTVVTHVISGDLWAGAEVQVFNLCMALVASPRLRLTAVVFNEGVLSQKLRSLGLKVEIADESRYGPLTLVTIIRNHCRREGTKVLHTHGFKENILGIIGKDLAGVPCSLRTVHGNPETEISFKGPHKWLIRQLDLLLGRLRQQTVVAVSSQLEATLGAQFPGKVEKIFNFVDVDGLRQQWPRAKALSTRRYRIGIVGRLVPVKRIDLFIRTIAILNQRGLPCTGVIIGSGPLEQEMRALSASLGMMEEIEFKGFIDPAYDELRKLDALLMTSDHEGLPMTLLEALAIETPVIAHRVGGIPEVLADGDCGWLVDEQTPESYAEVTIKALGAESELGEKSRKGLLHALETFSLKINTRQYEELYTR
ncbi:glycosyltransferase [Marinobacter qingdaonensis]|uniref:Glycosyltransferase n=1 Tax=Marinobacter qingdaonensis TaxID=3108486 RepID=A0ABU5P1B1_9GAMM|nr:glycosyltransferase [Marinobacter sp. ASW11-75]MEA1081848.1 glycosyltransferase [Marinobacter sp. ASW11-75]